MERRDFLRVIATSAGVAAAGGVMQACGGWSVNSPKQENASPPDSAGRILFSRSQFPELAKVGGSVMLKTSATSLFLVMRVSETDYRATSGFCTHAQCPVGYVASRQIIECPCHGAQFKLDGKVLRKPALSALSAYPVRTNPDTDELYVDTRGPNVPALDAGKIEFLVEDVPELSDPDNFFTFTPTGMDRPIIVVRYETRKIFTADATCTFGQCVLEYSVERRRYKCPCHGCEFDFAGVVKQGPATKSLRPLATEFDGTTVRIAVPG